MTPRTRTNFIEASLDIHQALDLFRRYRHPRVPVYRSSRDNLVGFLHAEDIVRIVFDDTDLSAITLDDLLRPPVVVPLTKKVDEMFDFFQANQARAAAVLNEFGGTGGRVTADGEVEASSGRRPPGCRNVTDRRVRRRSSRSRMIGSAAARPTFNKRGFRHHGLAGGPKDQAGWWLDCRWRRTITCGLRRRSRIADRMRLSASAMSRCWQPGVSGSSGRRCT